MLGRLFKSRPRTHSVYSGTGIYLLTAFFSHVFFNSSTGGLLNQEPNFNRKVKKNVKQCHQLFLI